MKHEEEAFIRILKSTNEKDKYYINKWYQNSLCFEELANPVDESKETEIKGGIYFCKRCAYFDTLECRVCYDYTVFKWNGKYREVPLSPLTKKTFKFKEWEEIYHAHSTEKLDPRELVKEIVNRMEGE